MNALIRFSVLFVLGVLPAACSYRPIGARGIPPEDLRQLRAGPVFADPSLDGDLEVGAVVATRLETGKLRVRIPLQNVSGERLEVGIKVTFADEGGRGIEGDETPYEYVGLPVGLSWHTVTSLKSLASTYKIQIRRQQ